jgi:DNA topoisomerase-3
VDGAEVLFPKKEYAGNRGTNRPAIGKCPRCGHPVVANSKGFFCESKECRFALWRDNRFFAGKQKTLSEEVARDLLEDGHSLLRGCYSPKTGFYYDATVVMEDDGKHTRFRMDFNRG